MKSQGMKDLKHLIAEPEHIQTKSIHTGEARIIGCTVMSTLGVRECTSAEHAALTFCLAFTPMVQSCTN